jgi:hypothetical protein
LEDIAEVGRRYDLVLDIADCRSVLRYLRCLRPRGRYVRIARTLSGFVEAAVVGGMITLATSRRMGVFASGG